MMFRFAYRRYLTSVLSLLFWTLVCLTLAGSVHAQQSKTLIIRPETGVLAGKTAYTNSYAVVIGVGDYAFLPKEKSLQFAAKDASDLRDVLVRSYGFPAENVTVLLDTQATKANIEAALSALADDKVKAEDRVLVYFSGHGQTVKLQDGGEMGFLIPHDAKVDLAHPENRGPYLATCLRMESIWSYLEASPAKHRLLIADACFGGLLIRGKALNSERPNKAVIASLLARPALQAMTAGASNEEAFEDPRLGHSAYTYKLLEELRAQAATPDSVFMASELAAALKTSVSNLTNSKQTPQFGNYRGTEGDFVFVSTQPAKTPVLRPLPANPGIAAAKFKKNSQDNADMVFIPAGEFTMGSSPSDIDALVKQYNADVFKAEGPQHKVMLDGYYIYRTPVTVAQYKQFVASDFAKSKGITMPPAPDFNPDWRNEDHPIVSVTYSEAQAYCEWAGVRLPTEAQWEKAASWDDVKKVQRKFPWGDDFDSSKLQSSKSKFGDAGGTKPVGSFPSGTSPYGVLDMAGNVLQWCSDWYDDKFYSNPLATKRNPENQSVGAKSYRVLRGGSWNDYCILGWQDYFRSAWRGKDVPVNGDDISGFRCVSGL